MYDTHVPPICAAMRADPKVFWRGTMFAILSIQQMFPTVPRALADVDDKGWGSRFLFGSKRDAYLYLENNTEAVWSRVCATDDAEEAIWTVAQIPGVGIIKSAFVCQMIGFDVACLDTRNIQREGRSPREFRAETNKRKLQPAFRRHIARYIRETGGRARELWDAWCTDVAATYGQTPDAISKVHLTTIVPVGYRDLPAPPVPLYGQSDDIPF
jgi:hypothetical protein